MLRVLMVVVPLVLGIYALVDLIQTDEEQIKGLPKVIWVFVILLFPLLGSLGWLLAGRPTPLIGGPPGSRPRIRPRRPQRPKGPDDDPDFLKGI